jgi:hypothetical protein
LGDQAVLVAKPAARAPVAARAHPPPAAKPAPPAAGSAVRALLERAVAAENHVDTLVQAAARGKTFSPAQLLALQASVFRYSQTVEVASRVADRLVGAIKQTVGTSI